MTTWLVTFGGSFYGNGGGKDASIYLNKVQFVAKYSKMEDWEIPEQDDFESRYADELEMLDDLDGEGKFSVGFFSSTYVKGEQPRSAVFTIFC